MLYASKFNLWSNVYNLYVCCDLSYALWCCHTSHAQTIVEHFPSSQMDRKCLIFVFLLSTQMFLNLTMNNTVLCLKLTMYIIPKGSSLAVWR